MTALERNRRLALGLGIGGPFLQLGREILWGRWPRPEQWPVLIDAYLGGALLVGAALVARRSPVGRAFLAAAWGICCGMLYRSFFEQVADPARHAGHHLLVLVVKGAILALMAVGLVGALRASSSA